MSWLILGLALLAGALGVGETATDAARPRMRQGIPGAPVYGGSDFRSGINGAGMVAQTGTITVDTATDSATYTVTINGIAISFTNGTSSTTTTTAVLLAAAINAEPRVRGQVAATAAVAVVTLTAQRLGTAGAFTASDSDAKLTTVETVTAAADGSTMGFGLACIQTAYAPAANGAPAALGGTERIIAVPKTTSFTAQVQTITVPVVTSNVIEAVIWEVRGGEEYELRRCQTTFATDKDTTLDALILELETTLPANTVSVTADNATATAIVFTAEIPGYEFRAAVLWKSGGTAPTITSVDTTGPSEATSLNRAFRGITKFAPDREAATLTSTTGSYPANSVARYTAHGVVWVTSTQSPSSGDTVYVELAAGSTQGRFYTDASSTRVALSKRYARWERDGLVSTDNLAAIRLEA